MTTSINVNLGLVWFVDSDPSAGAGVPAPLNQFAVRTDVPSLYYKSGAADTAWTLAGTGVAGATTIINNLTAGLAGLYGPGYDGDVTIGAGTTTLTRSMFYNNLTINAGGVLAPAGYQVFVANTLTGTNGRIDRQGLAGANAVAGAGGAGGVALGVGLFPASAQGGAGGNAGAAGSLGSNASNVPQEYTSTAAGNGGSGTNSGGGGGSAGKQGETQGRLAIPIWALAGKYNGITALGTIGAGGGGGGGGAGGTSGGGGGGSGGGYTTVAAKVMSCSAANFKITVKGGNGGNAGANGGNAGGGGGGQGGVAVVVYSLDGGVAPVTEVVGGTPGNGVGTGAAGQQGGVGLNLIFKLGGG